MCNPNDLTVPVFVNSAFFSIEPGAFGVFLLLTNEDRSGRSSSSSESAISSCLLGGRFAVDGGALGNVNLVVCSGLGPDVFSDNLEDETGLESTLLIVNGVTGLRIGMDRLRFNFGVETTFVVCGLSSGVCL